MKESSMYYQQFNFRSCFCSSNSGVFFSKKEACISYEKLIKESEAYKRLIELKKKGRNLNIVGENVSTKKLLEIYEENIFDHEMILFTLLTVDEKDYPWNLD